MTLSRYILIYYGKSTLVVTIHSPAEKRNQERGSRELQKQLFFLDSFLKACYTLHMGAMRPAMTPERIAEINELIETNPEWNRTKLSKELCGIWDWRGENGQIKDISCRDVLRALDAGGKIKLPKRKAGGRMKGSGSEVVALMLHDTTPIEGLLSEIAPLSIEVVSVKNDLAEFKSYIAGYHYLGYDRNIGENIKYFVKDRHGQTLACLMFGSAAWKCDGRDKFIGWGRQSREKSLRYLTNNSRFLIFPWVKVPHLASHILSLICRRISNDWVTKYGHPLYMLETFVECNRFQGTCYKAANWIHVGKTTGRGRDSKSHKAVLPIKDVLVYPLNKRFRELLKQDY